MNTKTLFSTNNSALLVFFAVGLMLVSNVGTILGQDDKLKFVNSAFAPLKICNVAGSGIAVGTPFSFTVTTPGDKTNRITTSGNKTNRLLKSYITTQVILAGPMATGPGTQNGFCDFINGPFTDSDGVVGGALINGLGSFAVGSRVVITESANTPGTTSIRATLISIFSPTTPVIGNLGTRTATITSMINGINEVHFVNTAPPIAVPFPQPKSPKRVRFF